MGIDPTGGGKGGSPYTRHLRYGEDPRPTRDAPLSPRGRIIFYAILGITLIGGVILVVLAARS